MTRKKFLFHTMSAIVLSLALTTVGYANEVTDPLKISEESTITEQLENPTPEAPTDTANSTETNIPTATAEETTIIDSTQAIVAPQPTSEQTTANSEDKVSIEATSTPDVIESPIVNPEPIQGHAPANTTAEQIDNTQQEQSIPTPEKIESTTPEIKKTDEIIKQSNDKAADSPKQTTTPKTNEATQKIVIVDPVASPAVKATPVKGVSVTTYKVKKGDTLYLLSRNFGTTVSAIKTTNNLKSNYLYIGQILKIPGTFKSSSANSGYTTVTVKKGDTLYLLSKRYGTSVSAIKSANGLKSSWLAVGQKLKIPAKTSQTAANRTVATTASRSEASRSEVLLLARLIYGESRGESYEGQVAVGAVVLNRVKSSLFPNTIAGVIYQKNEFSVVLDGQINMTPNATAIKAAEAALGGYDPTGGALYYWNPVKAPNNRFLNSKPILARIGSHVFAK